MARRTITMKDLPPLEKRPAKRQKLPLPVGRPSIKTPELCDAICEMIADGYSLREACDKHDIPNRSTIFRWLEADPEFATKYTKAREIQVENDIDDMRRIADDGKNDFMERDGKTVLNGENIQRSRLRLEQRRWFAEKLVPKKYGAKLAIGGDPDAPPVKVAHTFDVSGLTLEELDVFEKAIMKVTSK